MLVSHDLDLAWPRSARSGSGMLKLSSSILELSLTSSIQGGPSPSSDSSPLLPSPWNYEVRLSMSMHELSLSMPEPMLNLSMPILTTCQNWMGRNARMDRMGRNAGWTGWAVFSIHPDGLRMGRNAGWAGWGVPDGPRMVSNCPELAKWLCPFKLYRNSEQVAAPSPPVQIVILHLRCLHRKIEILPHQC